MTVTYYALSPADLDQLVQERIGDVFISAKSVCERLEISPDTLADLVAKKRLTRYEVPDHPRLSRFKLSEVNNLLKPINQ